MRPGGFDVDIMLAGEARGWAADRAGTPPRVEGGGARADFDVDITLIDGAPGGVVYQAEIPSGEGGGEPDDFDLDIKYGGPRWMVGERYEFRGQHPTPTAVRTCDGCIPTEITCTPACNTGYTCGMTCECPSNQTCYNTCQTCATQCAQPTCWGAATCYTCETQCGQGTCVTCRGQNTCDATCPDTCPNTCAPTCQNTCAATCPNTCPDTCGGTCGTCATCQTCPGQGYLTCYTCGTCAQTCPDTCDGWTCDFPCTLTCGDTCGITCGNTCAIFGGGTCGLFCGGSQAGCSNQSCDSCDPGCVGTVATCPPQAGCG